MDTTASMTTPSLVVNQIDAVAGPISAFEVSSTHQHVAFGDEAGCFHLYTNNPHEAPFNQYSQESTFPDAVSY